MDKFKTKKSLGQNFLQDQNIIRKIVSTADVEGFNVLEIGPGQGALTSYLIEDAKKVLSVEIDGRLIDFLQEKYADKKNFKLLNKDFLKTQKEDFSYILDQDIKLVANLPYYITTPIIIKALTDYNFISQMYVMVQKEVAVRFESEYKKKTYGAITVLLQTYFDIKYEFTVKNTVFIPQPKVDSAIISLKRKKDIKEKDFSKYENFIHACFRQKRKLLSNNLTQVYGLNKDEVITFLEKCGYTKNIRPEEIKVEQYSKLYKEFFKTFTI